MCCKDVSAGWISSSSRVAKFLWDGKRYYSCVKLSIILLLRRFFPSMFTVFFREASSSLSVEGVSVVSAADLSAGAKFSSGISSSARST